jgi:predicted lysophospholipase L1 biosynthesis ABC-type transport system permease subunit
MGIPILAGRPFDSGDPETSIIVNDVLARRFWGDASPVGRRFRVSSTQPWTTVVGVARGIRRTDSEDQGMAFYRLVSKSGRAGFYNFIVRTDGDKAAALQFVKNKVWELDSRLPIVDALSMDDRLGESLARPRFFLSLVSAFALTAVLLASIGVYGMSAYWVSRRRRELAIRIALGATQQNVMAMVLGRGVRLAAVGAVLGLALAFAGSRAIESLLFGTSARDPLTLIGVTILLGTLALVACSLPALKASRVDPMSALRAE